MFNTRETNDLETALITAERERDAALAENAALKKRCEWFRAAHMLLAQDEVFVRAPTEPGFINMASATVVDGEPAIYVLCSDTFALSYADAEEATYADATELLRIGVSEGWPGLVRWVQARRHEKGDPCEPVMRMRDRMATIDSMRERAEKAERERDAALATIEGNTVPPTGEGPTRWRRRAARGCTCTAASTSTCGATRTSSSRKRSGSVRRPARRPCGGRSTDAAASSLAPSRRWHREAEHDVHRGAVRERSRAPSVRPA